MTGYDGDAEATVQTWRDLWLHTRDLGHLDENGCLHFFGREQNAIRRRGENISSYELELALRGHPAVHDCIVVGVPSPLGEQDVKIVLVPGEGRIVPSEVHDFLAGRVARHMLPRFIEVRETLPFTALGKIDREALMQNDGGVWDADAPLPSIGKR
jgi:crotonobetaine/carnitine-CoA ligase